MDRISKLTNNTFSRESKGKFYISCKISNYESCSDSFIPFFGYIEYKITLKTNLKRWEIKRRFKHFDELHKKLSRKIKNLPKLPKKTIFKSQNIINDRKIKLQKYLTNLLRRNDVYNHDLIFDFIELKKEEYLLMNENLDDDISLENSPFSLTKKNQSFLFLPVKNVFDMKNSKDDVIVKDNFYYSSLNLKEEEVNSFRFNKNKKFIIDFLDDLNSKKKEMSLIIKNFKEKILFNNDKKINFDLKSEDIYKLFFGDKLNKKLGLLFHCGDIKVNIIGAELCMELLTKLINFEYNLNSEHFIEILRLGKLENFYQINFVYHLECGKPSIFAACCKVFKYIINNDKGINIEKLLFEKKKLNRKS